MCLVLGNLWTSSFVALFVGAFFASFFFIAVDFLSGFRVLVKDPNPKVTSFSVEFVTRLQLIMWFAPPDKSEGKSKDVLNPFKKPQLPPMIGTFLSSDVFLDSLNTSQYVKLMNEKKQKENESASGLEFKLVTDRPDVRPCSPSPSEQWLCLLHRRKMVSNVLRRITFLEVPFPKLSRRSLSNVSVDNSNVSTTLLREIE